MKICNDFKIVNYNLKNNEKNNIQKNEVSKNFYSLYNSKFPAGVNYFAPVFGSGCPQTALKRAKLLKEKYAIKDLKYLLPNEVWSNKKIFKTIDKAGNKFDELVSKHNLTKESLTNVLKELLPESISEKIKISDFKDLMAELISQNYSVKEAQTIVRNYYGLTSTVDDNTVIYLPLERETEIKELILPLKSTFLHELKHALTNKCTNVQVRGEFDKRCFDNKTAINETKFYNEMFMEFERIFQTIAGGDPVKLNKQTMIEFAENTKRDKMFNSEEELLKDMDKEFSEIIQNKINEYKKGTYALSKLIDSGFVDSAAVSKFAPDNILTEEALDNICKLTPNYESNIRSIVKRNMLPDDAFSSKSFWRFMQLKALDEKQAYTTEKYLRELYVDKNQPVDFELQSLMYGEMEKFFAQKAKAAND